jgi:hypothetical protein
MFQVSSRRDVSDPAAKRLYKTAQGFNPGSGDRKGALKAAPDVWRGSGIRREQPNDAPRPPLSGRISRCALPRAESFRPWAVLYSRFAAKIRHLPSEPKSPSLGACPAKGLTSEIILLLSA